MSINYHERAEITNIKNETPDIVRIIFDGEMEAEPGQFLMAWLPDAGERPISISGINPGDIYRVGR